MFRRVIIGGMKQEVPALTAEQKKAERAHYQRVKRRDAVLRSVKLGETVVQKRLYGQPWMKAPLLKVAEGEITLRNVAVEDDAPAKAEPGTYTAHFFVASDTSTGSLYVSLAGYQGHMWDFYSYAFDEANQVSAQMRKILKRSFGSHGGDFASSESGMQTELYAHFDIGQPLLYKMFTTFPAAELHNPLLFKTYDMMHKYLQAELAVAGVSPDLQMGEIKKRLHKAGWIKTSDESFIKPNPLFVSKVVCFYRGKGIYLRAETNYDYDDFLLGRRLEAKRPVRKATKKAAKTKRVKPKKKRVTKRAAR